MPGLPGRNDPCSCGSGKKYKKCCMGTDEASRAREQAARPGPDFGTRLDFGGEDHLDEWSNGARDAIDAGRLDEAEALSEKLIAEYPDVHDGHELRGLIREKQGRWADAAAAFQEAWLTVERMGPKYVDPEVGRYLREQRDAARARAERG
jgi:tetratricopeptide (TPR) repeat protein